MNISYSASLRLDINQNIPVFFVRSYPDKQYMYDVSSQVYPTENGRDINIQLSFSDSVDEDKNRCEFYLVYYINQRKYIEKI